MHLFKINSPRDHLLELIEGQTAVVQPTMLPELKLRLVTQSQAWWYADPRDLATLGIVDPYWAFCWPGGAALARYLLDNPHMCRKKHFLDLGTGCGVAAIAASLAGAASVIACDIDQTALIAAESNARLNHCLLELENRNLIGNMLASVDCVVAADITYSKELVELLMPWFEVLYQSGIEILIAEPNRGFLPKDLLIEKVIHISAACTDVPLESGCDVAIYRYKPWQSEKHKQLS